MGVHPRVHETEGKRLTRLPKVGMRNKPGQFWNKTRTVRFLHEWKKYIYILDFFELGSLGFSVPPVPAVWHTTTSMHDMSTPTPCLGLEKKQWRCAAWRSALFFSFSNTPGSPVASYAPGLACSIPHCWKAGSWEFNPMNQSHGLFFFFFFPSHLWSSPFYSLSLLLGVTQILGHIAGSFPSSPLQLVLCSFIAGRFQLLFPPRRLVLNWTINNIFFVRP